MSCGSFRSFVFGKTPPRRTEARTIDTRRQFTGNAQEEPRGRVGVHMRFRLAFVAAVVSASAVVLPGLALAATPPEEPVGPVSYQPYVLEGARPAAGANVDGPN